MSIYIYIHIHTYIHIYIYIYIYTYICWIPPRNHALVGDFQYCGPSPSTGAAFGASPSRSSPASTGAASSRACLVLDGGLGMVEMVGTTTRHGGFDPWRNMGIQVGQLRDWMFLLEGYDKRETTTGWGLIHLWSPPGMIGRLHKSEMAEWEQLFWGQWSICIYNVYTYIIYKLYTIYIHIYIYIRLYFRQTYWMVAKSCITLDAGTRNHHSEFNPLFALSYRGLFIFASRPIIRYWLTMGSWWDTHGKSWDRNGLAMG